MKRGYEGRWGEFEGGMQPFGSGLRQRYKHKLAQMHPRVGECKLGCVHYHIVNRYQVYVDHAVDICAGIVTMRPAVDAAFDGLQDVENIVRIV